MNQIKTLEDVIKFVNEYWFILDNRKWADKMCHRYARYWYTKIFYWDKDNTTSTGDF